MTATRRLSLPDLIEITPARHGDDRGTFSEVWNDAAFRAAGIDADWVQDNQSRSAARGTVRGLHYQLPPVGQDKLIRVLRGSIHDVGVDIRPDSPTYGRWASVVLSAETGNQLFVPKGFAHGFMTLEDDVEVLYKVSAPYSREHDRAIRWDDATLAIDWPAIGEPTLSAKDVAAPCFGEHDPYAG